MAERADRRDRAAELEVLKRQVAEGQLTVWALRDWVAQNAGSGGGPGPGQHRRSAP